MPEHNVNFAEIPELADPSLSLIHAKGGLRIRRKNSAGVFDIRGSFTSGEMVFDTWKPRALQELTGFIAHCHLGSPDDKILFRLSPDEGATPLVWDGANWVAPGGANPEWNTVEEIDTGISSFPYTGSLSQIVHLESGNGFTTPVLFSTTIFWEACYDVMVDAVESLVGKLLTEVSICGTYCVLVDSASSVDVADSLWLVEEPIKVYNRTNDPNQTTDLFVSLVGTTINFVGPQTGEIFVEYKGRLPISQIHVISDEDEEFETHPAVIIRTTTTELLFDNRVDRFEEFLLSKGVIRERIPPTEHAVDFVLVCETNHAIHTKKLADAIGRSLRQKEFITSLALDEEYPIIRYGTLGERNQVSDKLLRRMVGFTIVALEWYENFRDVPMATKLCVNMRSSVTPPHSSPSTFVLE